MEHPVQASPSQSSGADVVASRAAQNAISENEKIFPIFAQRLASSEPKEFVNTARKLAAWLSSEKAYYPAARPKIVELLEIALSAFMDTFAHHPLLGEIAEHQRQLIQAVVPFEHTFRENELQSRLQRVILDSTLFLSRISASTTYITAPSEGLVAASAPSFTYTPSANTQPASSSPTAYHPSMRQPQPSLSMLNIEKRGPAGSVHPEQLWARNFSEVVSSSRIEANPTLSPAVSTVPQPSGNNVSPTTTSKPLPRRAGRAELSEELMARDLDWFRSNQSAMVNRDLNVPPSVVGESLPPPPSDVPHVPRRSPSPKKKTARIVPSRRLPRRVLDATQEVDPGITSAEPLAKDRSCENAEDVQRDQMDVDKENSPVSYSTAVQPSDKQHVSPPDDLQFEPQPVATPSNEPSIERQTPQTDYQSAAVESLVANGNSMAVRSPALDGMESMDASESVSESFRFPSQCRLESTALQSPQTPRLHTLTLPPLVNALDPPLNLNFRILETPPTQPERPGGDANPRRFSGDTIVLHSTQGKTFSHAHVFDLNLSESIFSKISKWVNRRSYPFEASQGVCISLACYSLPEFFGTIHFDNGKPDVEALLSWSSCSWPSSNRVSLHIKSEKRHTIVTLSPPLFLNPDQCVDVSSLMELGNNTLEIVQSGDLSEYLIVLHAHSPTRLQLAVLDVVRSADERWKRFLDVISGRVVPGNVLGNTPAGVVEVHS